LAISAFAMVAALKKVDFPQFGLPASAKVIMVFPHIRAHNRELAHGYFDRGDLYGPPFFF